MEKAVLVIHKYRAENDGVSSGYIWIDVTSRDLGSDPSGSNPFIFTNGTEVEDANALIRWAINYGQPEYEASQKCVQLRAIGLYTDRCASILPSLCRKEVECEKECEKCEECSSNSGSDLSRANFPALFMAASVFKAFYVGPVE